MSPLNSMVRYEMHRRLSRTRGAGKAPVGQASRHRVHVPHRSVSKGASSARSRFVRTTAMKHSDPRLGSISIVFFPIHPMPARCANSRSGTGPASTNDRAMVDASPSSRRNPSTAARGSRSAS